MVLTASISACSTITPSPQNAAAPGEAQTISINDGQSLSPLPDAALPQKSCGMILWTLDAQRPTPVFRFVAGGEAEIMLGAQKIMLSRIDYGGASGFGVYESQTFTSGDLTVSVNAQFGPGFDGGAYLERGLIKVEVMDGWSIIAPAAGIAGCRSGK